LVNLQPYLPLHVTVSDRPSPPIKRTLGNPMFNSALAGITGNQRKIDEFCKYRQIGEAHPMAPPPTARFGSSS